jgi:hypothetical protein
VTIVQGEGLSWAGYPDDTQPSSRDFLPGLSTLMSSTQTSGEGSNGAHPGSQDQRRTSSGTRDSGSNSNNRSMAAREDPQPPIALGRVSLHNARLAILVVQEVFPRYLQHVTGTIILGHAYR